MVATDGHRKFWDGVTIRGFSSEDRRVNASVAVFRSLKGRGTRDKRLRVTFWGFALQTVSPSEG